MGKFLTFRFCGTHVARRDAQPKGERTMHARQTESSCSHAISCRTTIAIGFSYATTIFRPPETAAMVQAALEWASRWDSGANRTPVFSAPYFPAVPHFGFSGECL